MNLIEEFEKKQIARLTANKEIPLFKAGDTISVGVKIKEGDNERIQLFEGVVIARCNRGLSSSFVVRKISYGEGTERRFMIYSPLVHSIKVLKRGIVRRAKLYYLRDRSGKAARIREDISFHKSKKAVVS